jgi:hypothetical protein
MDAIWFAIADVFEFIFRLVKPVGMAVDIIFTIVGIVGIIFWLWYTVYVDRGGRNFMADPPGSRS